MKTTPLHAQHVKLKGKMVPFSGWEMPLHYGSQIEEHLAVREALGIFDVSHMQIIDVEGPEATEFARTVFANDLQKCSHNRALYTAMLNESGGIIDDLILYRISDIAFRIISNAGTSDKDWAHLKECAEEFNVSLHRNTDLALVAVQGPHTLTSCQDWLPSSIIEKVKALKPFSFIQEDGFFIARTGYTGEPGLEISLPATEVESFFQTVITSGAKPIGLGARDSLRLEAGLNLYGADMDEGVTPFQSNIAWTLDFSDPDRDFIGKAALQMGMSENAVHLKGAVLQAKGILKAGQDIFSNGKCIGTITSSAWSPLLSRAIAMVRLNTDVSVATVHMRSKSFPLEIVSLPFYRKGKLIQISA